MMVEPITRFSARAVVLPRNDVDTDQIIPARFLKVTTRDGLGEALFADWRYRPDGSPDPAFPLNAPSAAEAKLLVAGDNFGCGSSREHAAWALLGFGFRAVVSTDFADIFRNNALGNGLLPIQLAAHEYDRLLEVLQGAPDAEFTLDLPEQVLVLPGGERLRFPIENFAKHCLIQGVDRLGFLLAAAPDIERFEAARSR